MKEELKELLDRSVSEARFGMARLAKAARALFRRDFTSEDQLAEHSGDPNLDSQLAGIEARLNEKTATHAFRGILRTAFLIELVNNDTTSTKFDVRWSERLRAASDPRYADFDTCYEIFAQLIGSLDAALEDPEKRDIITLIAKWPRVPYEMPIDYAERRIGSPIHEPENIVWLWNETTQKVVKLRELLLNPSSNPQAASSKAAYGKIEVKTYQTDRAQTGLYKTNREKRWEALPGSVQYALRSDCLQIEYTLLNQLCHFEGFNRDLIDRLEDAGLLESLEIPSRCPVTRDPLLFTEFEREVSERVHGRASFQVGHLNPLKAVNDDPQSGHTAQNISWISEDGNRIQGRLSLAETRDLLRRIQSNYAEVEDG
jgi:hypothetical protein